MRRFTWLILSKGTLCSSVEETFAVLHTAYPSEGYSVQQSEDFDWKTRQRLFGDARRDREKKDDCEMFYEQFGACL
jgi:hypothetical protein